MKLLYSTMDDEITNPEEKLLRYRKAALEAEQSAKRAEDPDIKRAYLGIMRTWIYLADELEREMAFLDGDGSMNDQSNDGFVPPRVEGEARKSR
jgi:hypothetical protein